MNKLQEENRQNRLVYRELFLKANDAVKKQLSALKNPAFCEKCRLCCKIRYSELSPLEVFELSKKDDFVSKRYVEMFLPYGADEGYLYDEKIDISKNHYEARKINAEYVDTIIEKLGDSVYFYYCSSLNENDECEKNYEKSLDCSSFPNEIKTVLPCDCGFREWQKLALEKIRSDIGKDIVQKIAEINAHRQNFSCNRCATCCKIASSEFSYEELKSKAQKGDKFAKDFTSVFIPYKDDEIPSQIFPEFVEMLQNSLKEDESVYFYYCPHLGEDNLCTRYDSRPGICRDFPDNPLVMFPPGCGFEKWKEDVHVAAMMLHALIQICDFNVEKIESCLC